MSSKIFSFNALNQSKEFEKVIIMKANYTHPSISTNIPHNAGEVKKTTAPAHTMSEERYNTIGAMAGLAVLAGIGIAIIHSDKILDLTSSLRKICAEPKAREINLVSPISGPKFDVTKGKTAIADAWDGYINDVEKRIQSHNTNYVDIFNNNSEQLDKYEALAKIKGIGRKYNQVA